jgi:hypothetical protein
MRAPSRRDIDVSSIKLTRLAISRILTRTGTAGFRVASRVTAACVKMEGGETAPDPSVTIGS